jgi:hypothetical protein
VEFENGIKDDLMGAITNLGADTTGNQLIERRALDIHTVV